MTTYADLLAQTALHLREGAISLAADRFWTSERALDAIGDYHGLLDAIASHARRLLWPAQLGRIGLARHREGLPPIERAAIGLAGAIEAITGESRPHPSQISASRTPWARASLTLRAAGDLVATHYGPNGHPRTPDAVRATTADYDAGLADLGHLARAVFAQEEPLALRAIQSGVPRGVVTRQLPGLGPLAELAHELSTSSPGSSKAYLDLLGQTRPPSHTDDPAGELADRMVRLRQATWALAGDGTDELASLRTIAGLGVAVHAHAAAFYGADLLAPESGAPDTGPGALVRHARTWQHLHRALSELAVLAPPAASIRDDAVAAAALLGRLAPIDRCLDQTRPSEAERRIGAALNGAVQVMGDIAVHEGATFDRLTRTGLLWIPARTLPRDAVTDHPDLVASRLAGRLAKPPREVTGAIARLYDALAERPHAQTGTANAIQAQADNFRSHWRTNVYHHATSHAK